MPLKFIRVIHRRASLQPVSKAMQRGVLRHQTFVPRAIRKREVDFLGRLLRLYFLTLCAVEIGVLLCYWFAAVGAPNGLGYAANAAAVRSHALQDVHGNVVHSGWRVWR